jgi:hypothetical protein
MMSDFNQLLKDQFSPSFFNFITGNSANKATEEDKAAFAKIHKEIRSKHKENFERVLIELSNAGVDVGEAIYEAEKQFNKEEK